jgi:hypothetical protein
VLTQNNNELTERLINLLIEKEQELKLRTAQVDFLIRRNYEILAELDAAEQSTI